MTRGVSKRRWIKIDITGWLHGSIRWGLTPEERSVWADLICLAGECGQNGAIVDNDGRSLPWDYLANHLNITMSLFGSTIAKCKKEGMLEDLNDNRIVLTNWNHYQSEYERQKKYRVKESDKDEAPTGLLED